MAIVVAHDPLSAHLLRLTLIDPWTGVDASDAIHTLNMMITESHGDGLMSVIVDARGSKELPDSAMIPFLIEALTGFRGRYAIFLGHSHIGHPTVEVAVRRMGRRARRFAFASTLDEAYHKVQLLHERDGTDDTEF